MPASLTADVADVDTYDVLADKEGTVWIRLYSSQSTWEWSYLSDSNAVSWDIHPHLPEEYEPYLPLDAVAARILAAHAKLSSNRLGRHQWADRIKVPV